LAREISDHTLIAADVDFCCSIDDYFYGALASIAAATADHGGTALVLLGTSRGYHCHGCRESCE
jgi:hypothetical protein